MACPADGWYIIDLADAQLGPLSRDALKQLYASKKIDDTCSAWHDSIGGDWKPVSELPNLKSYVKPAAAVAPVQQRKPRGFGMPKNFGQKPAMAFKRTVPLFYTHTHTHMRTHAYANYILITPCTRTHAHTL
jgi:hypothetical protein